ncbi:MAG: UDP-N-acetylmuramoyl-L-alanine--D-glutamate ligase [Phycisphaerales bacterium]|nr:UDP-N-acetylmuramoyl-L-alanine--D-glutamate ligase [Phycisphaerales bacterium]
MKITKDARSMYDFSNKNIIVMGLGRFGGGLGITRWLVGAGAKVIVTDTSDSESLQASLDRLNDLIENNRIRVVLGPHDPSVLDGADMLVVNPAVPMPWENSFIEHARSAGILVTTEIQIALSVIPNARVIAVTGSAGKSTTSAMIHHVLDDIGRHSILAGNIGGSLLNHLDELTDDTVIVLELSSAMLHWLWDPQLQQVLKAKKPCIACMTNFMPNHLDWHGNVEHYEQSKQRLLQAISTDGTVILNHSISSWESHVREDVKVVIPSDPITGGVLLGRHNAINTSMAVEAVFAIVKPDEHIKSKIVHSAKEFAGLPHRLNRCHVTSGVEFYNDSKSTVPDASVRAIDALSVKYQREQIHLIAGGYDKGSDLSAISDTAQALAGLYAIGATSESLCSNAADHAFQCNSLERAIHCAFDRAKNGDVIVLSPGCASWDQFTNYEERGELFESLSKQCRRGTSC